jgi:hypothetical protein
LPNKWLLRLGEKIALTSRIGEEKLIIMKNDLPAYPLKEEVALGYLSVGRNLLYGYYSKFDYKYQENLKKVDKIKIY